MPAGFMQNPLVRDYTLPPLAEVQHPWVHQGVYSTLRTVPLYK